MIGPFLMLLGALLMWVAVRGKADNMLNVIGIDAQRIQDNMGTDFAGFMLTYVWTPLETAISHGVGGAFSAAGSAISKNVPGAAGLASLGKWAQTPLKIPDPTHPGQFITGPQPSDLIP